MLLLTLPQNSTSYWFFTGLLKCSHIESVDDNKEAPGSVNPFPVLREKIDRKGLEAMCGLWGDNCAVCGGNICVSSDGISVLSLREISV